MYIEIDNTGKLKAPIKSDLDYKINNCTIHIFQLPIMSCDASGGGVQLFDKQLISDFFKNSLSDFLPYFACAGLYILERNGFVQEVAVDYFAHSRYYYSVIDDRIFISDDWRMLPHHTNDLNIFQTLYFLNWDSCWNGETFFNDIKYFAPSFVYKNKAKGFVKEYVPFPDFNTMSLFDAIRKTVEVWKDRNDVAVMLSGGTDSAQIVLAAKKENVQLKYLSAHIADLNMFDNLQDEAGATMLAKLLNLDLDMIDIEIGDFLSGWNDELLKYVAFSYKDGRLWQGIAKEAKKLGVSQIVNGQNADALYNYSYTGDSGNDVLMRRLTTDTIMKRVFNEGQFDTELLEAWKLYNKDDISPEKYLAWIIVKGNGYMNYHGKIVDKAANDNTKKYYENELTRNMSDIINLLHIGQIKTVQQLVAEGKLVGYVDGEDTRCISGACLANEVRSIQLYTTPLVYDAQLKLSRSEEDVNHPKRMTKKEVGQSEEFIRAQKCKERIEKKNTYSASQVWEIVYSILDKKYNLSECIQIALRKIKSLQLLDLDMVNNIMSADVGIKMRIAWMGLCYDVYSKTVR